MVNSSQNGNVSLFLINCFNNSIYKWYRYKVCLLNSGERIRVSQKITYTELPFLCFAAITNDIYKAQINLRFRFSYLRFRKIKENYMLNFHTQKSNVVFLIHTFFSCSECSYKTEFLPGKPLQLQLSDNTFPLKIPCAPEPATQYHKQQRSWAGGDLRQVCVCVCYTDMFYLYII